VYGFGERKTPDAFVQACDKFIYTEVLRPETASKTANKPPVAKTAKQAAATSTTKDATPTPPKTTVAAKAEQKTSEPLPLELIRQAIEEASDDQGWAFLGTVGSYLNKIRPDFDSRLYGHRKLSDLLKHHPRHVAIEERGGAGGGPKAIHVRILE
jgi:hypothetical protein